MAILIRQSCQNMENIAEQCEVPHSITYFAIAKSHGIRSAQPNVAEATVRFIYHLFRRQDRSKSFIHMFFGTYLQALTRFILQNNRVAERK